MDYNVNVTKITKVSSLANNYNKNRPRPRSNLLVKRFLFPSTQVGETLSRNV